MNFDSPQWSDLFRSLATIAVIALITAGVIGGIAFLIAAR